jgi:hypothetical protein
MRQWNINVERYSFFRQSRLAAGDPKRLVAAMHWVAVMQRSLPVVSVVLTGVSRTGRSLAGWQRPISDHNYRYQNFGSSCAKAYIGFSPTHTL